MKLFLGTAQLSRTYGVLQQYRSTTRDNPVNIIREAQALGYSALDTSPVYGGAEGDIGASGTQLPVYTKLDPSQGVEESILRSQLALGRKFLDGVYLHEEFVASKSQRDLLKSLRDRKTHDIGDVGVSIYSEKEFHLANANPDIDIIQLPYNLFDSRFDEQFVKDNIDPTKKAFGRSIFLQGVLLQPPRDFPSEILHLRPFRTSLEKHVRDSGFETIDLALGFAVANQGLSGIIVGTSSIAELRDISRRLASLEGADLSHVLDFTDQPPWGLADPRRWGQ